MTEPIPSLMFWPGSLTARGFPALLEAAAAGDFTAMAVSPLMVRQMHTAELTDADILEMAAGAGVRLAQLDCVSSWAPLWYGEQIEPQIQQKLDFPAEACLDMATGLELDSILTIGAFDPGTVGHEDLVHAFASFCDDAAARGLRVELEFVPYWGIPELPAAWDIVAGAGRDNSGVLIDTWHLDKGSTDLDRDLDLLARIPARHLSTIQLADATHVSQAETLFSDGRYRRFPGDGDFDLARVVRLVENQGGLTTIGTEIFGDAIDMLSTVEAGRRCRAATEDVLREALQR